MSSTTYPVDTPRWLWNLFKRAIEDGTEYDKFNDRLVEGIAVDVQRFAEADLVDLNEFEQRRIDELLSDVSSDEDSVPNPSDGLSITDERAGDLHSTLESRGDR